jgi:hypothetical protein
MFMIAALFLFSLLNFSTYADSFTLERRDRVDDLICSHNGAGGGRKIDVENMPTKEKTSAIRRGDFLLSITI